MANQHQPFRVHHIARAFRAAERAGIKNPHVRVTLPGGGELHVHGVPDPGPKTSSSVRTSASLAKGGKGSMGDIGVRAFPLAKGGNTPMAGRGERTVTAASDAAGKQQAGSTGHKTASRGSKLPRAVRSTCSEASCRAGEGGADRQGSNPGWFEARVGRIVVAGESGPVRDMRSEKWRAI